jgi:hypothetical protein
MISIEQRKEKRRVRNEERENSTIEKKIPDRNNKKQARKRPSNKCVRTLKRRAC